MSPNNYNIYFFNSEKRWEKAASVKDNIINHMQKKLPLCMATVREYTSEIIMSDVNKNILSGQPTLSENIKIKYSNDKMDDIQLYHLGTLLCNQSKVYIFCQYSSLTNKLRVSIYCTNITYNSETLFDISTNEVDFANLLFEINKLTSEINLNPNIPENIITKLKKFDFMLLDF
jgi:hypothetical protein